MIEGANYCIPHGKDEIVRPAYPSFNNVLRTCKKTLPLETQTGAGTFGCYLNGKLITPQGGGIAPNRDCYYQQLASGDSGCVFHVSGRDYKVPTDTRSVAIDVAGIRIVEGMRIPLTRGVGCLMP